MTYNRKLNGCIIQDFFLWKGQKANLNQAQGQEVIWVPSSTTIVLALNGPSWQGGHGKIHKVWI